MQTEQNKPETPTDYTLTDPERAALAALNQNVILGKAAVYNAETAAERAKAALHDAETAFQGALNLLATAHGMDGGQLAADLSKITRG